MEQAGVAVDDRLDLGHRLGVVGLGVDADPELGEVRPDDLVGDLGAADVRAEVAHAGHGAQLLAGVLGDPPHRLERRARLLDPVHQEVVLLEVGQELLAQPDDGPARAAKAATSEDDGPARAGAPAAAGSRGRSP